MPYCSVKHCDSWKQRENSDIKFFRFPKEAIRRDIWRNACGRPFVNYNTATICSLHFTDDDWTLKDKLLKTPMEKRRLNVQAIPTKNVYSTKLNTERSVQETEVINLDDDLTEDENQRESEDMETAEFETCDGNNKVKKITSVGIQTELGMESARLIRTVQLEKELMELKREINLLKKENSQLSNLESSVSRIFTTGQIDKLKNPEKSMIWSLEDISAASSLHSVSPRAYTLLYEKKFPLPAPSTMRKRVHELKSQSPEPTTTPSATLPAPPATWPFTISLLQ